MCLQTPEASYLAIHGQKLWRCDASSEGRSGRGVETTRNLAVTIQTSSRSGRHDRSADRPQRDAGELQVRPGEGQADDGQRPDQRGDEMREREPPARENEPDDVADDAKRASADVAHPGEFVATHRLRAERQQRID